MSERTSRKTSATAGGWGPEGADGEAVSGNFTRRKRKGNKAEVFTHC